MPAPSDVTLLLNELREGNQEAANRLIPLIYSELRRMAGSYMLRERAGHTLQATALVNEVYLRLAGGERGITHIQPKTSVKVKGVPPRSGLFFWDTQPAA